MDNKYLTKAVKNASNGNRARTLYGFKNSALGMSQQEIKDAWKQASIDTKTNR